MEQKITTLWKSLLEEGKISKKTVCIAAKITQEQLDQYLAGNRHALQRADFAYLNELAMLIGLGLPLVDDHERVKAIVESLIDFYGYQLKELSKAVDISEDTIQKILKEEEVAIAERHSLAVRAGYLFYALKKTVY